MNGAQQVHLVLVETSGNQRFVFDTNKRRVNVGGSQLIYALGTTWVPDALRLGHELPIHGGPIEDGRPEVIVSSSGKALVLMPDRPSATALLTAVTTLALREAPGLDVCGVVSSPFGWGVEGGLARASEEVHRRFQDVRGRRAPADLRFLRLPIVSECATSGLPATGRDREVADGELFDLSRPTLARWKEAFKAGLERMATASDVRDDTHMNRMRRIVDYLADDAEWVAVVHADGNGVGSIFQDFTNVLPGKKGDDRAYADTLRDFSSALDVCAQAAFRQARQVDVPEAARDKGIDVPILPLILGGDDLTVVCDGEVALAFAAKFLTAFEAETANDGTVARVLGRLPAKPRCVAASAGVAITKRHFPFSAAYDLCEDLTRSAKAVKSLVDVPCSAFDFHVLHDSTTSSLESLRPPRAGANGGRYLPRSGPFVVTDIEHLGGASREARAWVSRHHVSDLNRRAAAVRAVDDHDGDERRKLPTSQTHFLRSAILEGPDVAEARFSELRRRYGKRGLDVLGHGEPSRLYWLDGVDSNGREIHRTALLDALDAATFLP